MKQYERFVFESYGFDEDTREITLNYSLATSAELGAGSEITFTETITLPKSIKFDDVDPATLERAIFGLHLIGGISYFKTCLPKHIEIHSGTLTKNQAEFWTKVYEDGLGEFFYKNNLDPHDRVHFPFSAESDGPEEEWDEQEKGMRSCLVAIGGGKDSLVTLELLKQGGHDQTLLRIGEHPLITRMAEEAELPLLSVKRALAPELFKLNEEGALNGHVPITAYLSFLSVVIGILTGRMDIVMSNERSANEGNVEWKGKSINHQWSKSLEFERMFQEYVRENISKNVACFSLLRRYSELKIVELFTGLPHYLPLFTSCNRNWHILRKKSHVKDADASHVTRKAEGSGGATLSRSDFTWCGICPKCAFAFLLLAAYLPKKEIVPLFGKNLFEDEALLPLYRELLGLEGVKPFECVGTPDEVKAAFLMAKERGDFDGTSAMNMFQKESAPSIKDGKKLIAEAMAPSDDHAIPEEFLSLVP